MTDTAKTTLWVVIRLVIVGGIWWFVGGNKADSDNQVQAPVQEVATTTPQVQTEVQDVSTSISVQDKTDSAIDTDLNKVDNQLKDLNSDSN